MKDRLLQRIDAFQQRHAWAGFPYAVIKKFGEDQGGNLCALLSYYAFLSVFPLFFVFVTVLGIVLRAHPDWQGEIVKAIQEVLPLLKQREEVDSAPIGASNGGGKGWALVAGLAVALWTGLGVANAAQSAFNSIYNVSYADRPNFAKRVLRSLLVVLVAALLLCTTLLSGWVTGAGELGLVVGMAVRVLAAAVVLVVDAALFAFLFRWLTARHVRWHDALPGAAVAAVLFFVLQLTATRVYTHFVPEEPSTGAAAAQAFGTVVGVLGFFYLLARVVLLCAEVNMVRQFRLWPRAIVQPPGTEADVRAYELHAETQRFQREEQIEVDYPARGDAARQRPADPAPDPKQPAPVHRDSGVHKRTIAGLVMGAAVSAWLHGRRSAHRSAGDTDEPQHNNADWQRRR